MYSSYKKSTIFEQSSPNISYAALTPNPSIFNSDVQVHSTLELSSSQTCNQSLSSVEYPTLSHSAYFTKNSPKIVTTVSETYLPLEPSGSPFSISSNNLKTYPARQDISALSYGSFENHFLWNTRLFCSQSHPMNQGLPTYPILDNIFNLSRYDKIPADIHRNISTITNDDKNSVNHNTPTTLHKITFNNNLNSNCSTIKRNPYSIEEILRKPEKKLHYTETDALNHQKKENVETESQSTDNKYSDHTNDLNQIHKRSRVRLKIHDNNV